MSDVINEEKARHRRQQNNERRSRHRLSLAIFRSIRNYNQLYVVDGHNV